MIRQPNLMSFAPELVDELNDFGLFSTLDVAHDVALRGNRSDTNWRPFSPVAISLDEPEELLS